MVGLHFFATCDLDVLTAASCLSSRCFRGSRQCRRNLPRREITFQLVHVLWHRAAVGTWMVCKLDPRVLRASRRCDDETFKRACCLSAISNEATCLTQSIS